jgi:hypothetical protein
MRMVIVLIIGLRTCGIFVRTVIRNFKLEAGPTEEEWLSVSAMAFF